MEGCKTYGGRKTYRTTHPQENCWSPRKRASGLVLRSCGPATEPENPQSPKIRKKHKIPHPGLAPENTEKIPKKYENGPKTAIFGRFCIFSGIFSVFPGVHPGWGILYFFRIFGLWGFSGSVAGPQDRKTRPIFRFLNQEGGWRTYQTMRGLKPLLGGVSFVRFSSPLFFPPPPWCPLTIRQAATYVIVLRVAEINPPSRDM